MTLSRYTSKDLDKIFDAVSTYSVGYDDLFNRMLSYGQVTPQYPPYNPQASEHIEHPRPSSADSAIIKVQVNEVTGDRVSHR